MEDSSSSPLPPPPPSSEEDDNLPSSHPARRREFGSKHETTNRNRGGWGEAMELAHQRDPATRATSTGNAAAAVDLHQFRNTEVGVGYQAKHVVRQKTIAATQTATTSTSTRTNVKPRIVDNNNNNSNRKTNETIEIQELLRNDGLRAFRKEIESILSS